jgi:SNF2 family DNA or RNA helicase
VYIQPRDRIHLSLDRDGERFIAKIYSVNVITPPTKDSSGQMLMVFDQPEPKPGIASRWAASEFPKRVPERKKHDLAHPYAGWIFAATDITAVLIRSCWAPEQIILDPDAKVVFDYLLTSWLSQDRAVEAVAQFRASKQLNINGLIDNNTFPLAPYQKLATNNAIHSDAYGLLMDMGTGKTPVVIARMCNDAVKHFAKTGRMYRHLVVAPKNVRTNWVNEIETFASCKGRVVVLRGGQIGRTKMLIDALTATESNDDMFTTVVVSYEALTRMTEILKAIEWDLMTLDESHFIKSAKTKRAQASHAMRDQANRRMILTGTAVANSVMDLWSQLEFLGKGRSGFMSFKNFKEFYGVYDIGPDGTGNKLVDVQNLPFIKERLARIAYIISKEEAMPNLPDKVRDVIEVTMTDFQRSVYEDLRKNLLLEIESDLFNSENRMLVVQNALTKLLRLAQITSGFIAWDSQVDEVGNVTSPKSLEFFEPNAKLEALVELLKEKGPNDKTIVWACWVPDIKRIAERLELEGIKTVVYYGATKDVDREEAVRSFNYDRDVKVFLGNPGAGGTGVNLLGYPPKEPEGYDTNCNHVIYYSQDWSSPKRSQSEDRAHRRGTREPVRITDLCVAGTIDEEIRARVVKKRTLAFEVSDIREILDAVLKGVVDDE